MTNNSVLKGIPRKVLSIKNVLQFSRKLLIIMKNVQKTYYWFIQFDLLSLLFSGIFTIPKRFYLKQ